MKNLRNVFAFLLIFGTNVASAEIAVLVHGYLGSTASWAESGVNANLIQAGWRHAGDVVYGPQGVKVFDLDLQDAENRFYAVQLPSQAPLTVQSSWLKGALNSIEKRNPGQPITLIGHSAGGVVSRLTITQYQPGNVKRLITIAAPHLGTDKAIQALDATSSGGMFGFLKKQVVRNHLGSGLYNTVQNSRGILIDLVPPRPGTLLYWLNTQQHPDIEYISVVRTAAYNIQGDIVVPPFSQDMNNIPVLAGKSKLHITAQQHELSPADGRLLMELL